MTTTAEILDKLEALINDARHAVHETDDPRTQALLETTAEVLGGLAKAYEDKRERSEPAWRGNSGRANLRSLSRDASDEP